jgi:hypothetical protein
MVINDRTGYPFFVELSQGPVFISFYDDDFFGFFVVSLDILYSA